MQYLQLDNYILDAFSYWPLVGALSNLVTDP